MTLKLPKSIQFKNKKGQTFTGTIKPSAKPPLNPYKLAGVKRLRRYT